MTTTSLLTGRAAVRDTLYNWIETGNIQNLNQFLYSFPKYINYQVNAYPGQMSRAAAIIFIQSETENRVAIGGAHNGIKRVDYSVVLQLVMQSTHRNSMDAMTDFDLLVDAVKARLRADHNFGDANGTLVWQGAEPVIDGIYGEPLTSDDGVTEIWAELRFDVTQMIHA